MAELTNAQKWYRKMLRTNEWKAFRLLVLARDNFKCAQCDTTEKLVAHHLYYKPNARPWEYDLSDMQTLCTACHFQEHFRS